MTSDVDGSKVKRSEADIASQKTSQEVRQGETKLGVRYVLGASILMAALALAAVFGFFGG